MEPGRGSSPKIGVFDNIWNCIWVWNCYAHWRMSTCKRVFRKSHRVNLKYRIWLKIWNKYNIAIINSLSYRNPEKPIKGPHLHLTGKLFQSTMQGINVNCVSSCSIDSYKVSKRRIRFCVHQDHNVIKKLNTLSNEPVWNKSCCYSFLKLKCACNTKFSKIHGTCAGEVGKPNFCW